MSATNHKPLWPTVIANVHRLIALKKSMQDRKQPDEYKKLQFSINSYEKWLTVLTTGLAAHQNDNPENPAEYVKLLAGPPLNFTKGLIGRFQEVMTNGCFIEFKDQESMAAECANPGLQAADPVLPKPETSVYSTVEAIPKKLAEEGERPGDEDPVGQRVYDLKLITGVGEAHARKMVEKGITLEGLLGDWEKFANADPMSGCLMLENMAVPEGYNGKGGFANLSASRQHALKFADLQARMAQHGPSLSSLTHHQLIGIKYFHDIKHKIPRAEIVKTEKYLQLMAKHMNPKFRIQCCGSYRRGRERSGDIDSLLYHEDLQTAEDVAKFEAENGAILQAFVTKLTKSGFLTDHLSLGDTKYMGVGHLPNKPGKPAEYTIHRRIDIRFVPANSFGSSLMYFTGSKTFNTTIRSACLKKGYTLCEYGLFKIEKDAQGRFIKKGDVYVKGEQVETKTEEDVFRFLGLEYKTPAERDI
jgi:hypothetical protein